VNGVDGAVGPQGPIGLTGAAGPQGPIGLTGATGPQGPIGLTGATGATGPQGVAGINGTNGVDGAVGPMGAVGPQGPIGLTGPQGPQGVAGASIVGPQGPVGPAGPQGPIGTGGVTLVDAAGTNMGQIYGFNGLVYYVVYNQASYAVSQADGGAFTPYTGALVGTITHIMYTGTGCTGTAYYYTGNTSVAGAHVMNNSIGTYGASPVYNLPARALNTTPFASLHSLGTSTVMCTNPVWNVAANSYFVTPVSGVGPALNVDPSYVQNPVLPIGPKLQ